jgi:hypothetical protein
MRTPPLISSFNLNLFLRAIILYGPFLYPLLFNHPKTVFWQSFLGKINAIEHKVGLKTMDELKNV